MKLPERIEFKLSDMLPLSGIRNKQNKDLVKRALPLGFWIGFLIGCLAGLAGWGRPLYYAWYFGSSVGAFMLVSAFKVVQKRHYQQTNVWLLPWLKIFYWVLFFLVTEGAILLLEIFNSGNSWVTVIKSTSTPNGIAYSNLLNAILVGVIVAFPSKIILMCFSRVITLPWPLSEIAENFLGRPIEQFLPESSLETHTVPKEISHLTNQAYSFGKKGDYVNALSVANEAVRICPKSSVAHNNRGCALVKLGQCDEAIKEFEKAIELIPENISSGLAIPDPYTDPVENLQLAFHLRLKLLDEKRVLKRPHSNWRSRL